MTRDRGARFILQLPPRLEKFVEQTVGLEGSGRAVKQVAHRLRELSESFRVAAKRDRRFNDAYFAYHFPINLAKAVYVGKKILARSPGIIAEKDEIAVCDIGCGDGAGMFGLYLAFREKSASAKIVLTGIDSCPAALQRCRTIGALLAAGDKNVDARPVERNARTGTSVISGRYDIIMASNALVEIVRTRTIPEDFIGDLLSRLTPGGAVVIVEPALKDCSRRLMQLRDACIKSGLGRVLIPCPPRANCGFTNIPGRDEWCHFSVPWCPPVYLARLSQELNRETDMMKFSYLVLTRQTAGLPLPAEDWSVVTSRLLREKGKRRIFVCAPAGRVELYRLDKNKSQTNAAFDRLTSGDFIELKNVLVKNPNRWQITEATEVKKLF